MHKQHLGLSVNATDTALQKGHVLKKIILASSSMTHVPFFSFAVTFCLCLFFFFLPSLCKPIKTLIFLCQT